MASPSNPQHEPTMEEILASIRKIISEDSTEQAPAAAAPVPEKAPEPVVEDIEVLELTQEVVEEPAPMPVMEAPKQADDIEFQSIEEEPPVSSTHYEPEPEIAAAPATDHGLFSDKSRQASEHAFASIEPEEDERPRTRMNPPAVDTATVEAVFERAVRDAFEPVLREWLDGNAAPIIDRMKPVIREWLDEHFPAMLEEAVRAEVARAARARPTRR